ncbi:hypothetical protein GE061_018834 [Apolygus lucorum]|uniref:Uncharacterized protein n=1 Tax=Apolygus lucorum TaxID=248454 RepID=A0A8S9X6S7_APOLU|nr:hypothetical protein GE061_018834 [Apolygus lucorum]
MLIKYFSLFTSTGFRKSRLLFSMMATPSPLLDQVPDVEIDAEGRFKYVLIRVYAPTTRDGNEPSKMIVRGNARGAYHVNLQTAVRNQSLNRNFKGSLSGSAEYKQSLEC